MKLCSKCGGRYPSYWSKCSACGVELVPEPARPKAEFASTDWVGDGTRSPDANVEAVREALLRRSKVGLKKYGTTTDRTDLRQVDWLRHAQEEALDLAVYLERLIQDLVRESAKSPTGAVSNGGSL
jgi:hypothetical protein